MLITSANRPTNPEASTYSWVVPGRAAYARLRQDLPANSSELEGLLQRKPSRYPWAFAIDHYVNRSTERAIIDLV